MKTALFALTSLFYSTVAHDFLRTGGAQGSSRFLSLVCESSVVGEKCNDLMAGQVRTSL